METILNNLYIVVHNVYSVQKVISVAKIVYRLGFKNLVISKAMGAAAQEGLPEVQKLALKYGGRLFILSDIKDIKELFPNAKIKLIVPSRFTQKIFNPKEIIKNASSGQVFIIVSGAEPGLSKREIEVGEAITLENVEEEIGAEGFISIILYLLKKELREGTY